MIQLDTNFLILAASAETPEALALSRWLSEGEETSTSAIAWMEFITGPVSEPIIVATLQVIEDRIVSVDRETAELAAKLLNQIGRKRTLRYDCLIAASSIISGAKLATTNRKDFERFTSFGLQLA